MPFGPGDRLGPYEISSAIGAGGMGEVYRARDTRLERDVAIKVLPDLFASDPEHLARFEREAKALAALNHPNIAAIYGVEEQGPSTSSGHAATRALVMELVEGETLADRIAHGRLPVDEALEIAKQVAEALEAAHEQSIIHRDLKPANIKITTNGDVKVLDFGLAKLAGPPEGGAYAPNVGAGFSRPDLSISPTITSPMMTGVGVLLGTAAYTAPEQAKGRPADKRSDIWAFGCVMYEMLTGKRAFGGEDVSDTLATVLKSDPDWSSLPADLPAPIRSVLRRCLVKDRRLRIADVSVVQYVLTDRDALISNQPDLPGVAPAAAQSRWRRMAVIVASAVAGGIVVGLALWLMLRTSTAQPTVTRFSFPLGQGYVISTTARDYLAISPDGARIAYVANSRLYLRGI